MSKLQPSLFEGARMTLADALDLTAASLQAYGGQYRHWALAYSGGKDSSATLAAVIRLIETGRVQPPQTLNVLYADTRMELPPLHEAAMRTLKHLQNGKRPWLRMQIVHPAMDDRFFVYMLGCGVPPPSNTFRWCTPQLKIEPMMQALKAWRETTGEKLLMLTGVRIGESAARDQRIALSCSKNGAECGQGWFQEATPESVADTLAPLLHWRVCHVWDWLLFGDHGLSMADVATVYGGDEAEEINARTGCVGCNLASRDLALDHILRKPENQYLAPLKRLRPLYAELKRPQNRLRKDGSERRKDGQLFSNPMRLGPLTMQARQWGLEQVLEIQRDINNQAILQHRPLVWLIDGYEERRIGELISAGTWPNGWDGNEPVGDIWMDEVIGEGVVQPQLLPPAGINSM